MKKSIFSYFTFYIFLLSFVTISYISIDSSFRRTIIGLSLGFINSYYAISIENHLIKENNLNEDSIEEIVKNSFNKIAPVFNNVSQHLNHMHFWNIMKNNPNGKIPSELENKINEDFGSVEHMKEAFINAGIGQFGSGWCWLVLNNGKLEITKTSNAENPIVPVSYTHQTLPTKRIV